MHEFADALVEFSEPFVIVVALGTFWVAVASLTIYGCVRCIKWIFVGR